MDQIFVTREIPDFFHCMGKGKKPWKHIKTRQDKELLSLFEGVYKKNFPLLFENLGFFQIPQLFHIIWLGPKPYPTKSLKYLSSWISLHPSWKILFWTDQIRDSLPPQVEQKQLDPALLGEYEPLFIKSTNYGEKSDLLRLVLLKNLGGIYIDHDILCKRSFEPFAKAYSFFTGLQNVGNHVLKQSAVVRNSIIGTAPHHPILDKALSYLKKRWEQTNNSFKGDDLSSQVFRVTHQGFKAFHDAVSETILDPHFSGIVFPAGFFNEIDNTLGLFSHEDMDGSWYREEMNYYENYLFERVHKLMKRLHLWIFIVSGLFFFSFSILFFLLWKVFYGS